jgi:hypothetical protein
MIYEEIKKKILAAITCVRLEYEEIVSLLLAASRTRARNFRYEINWKRNI